MRLKSILLPTALVLSLILNGAAVGYLYSQWDKHDTTLTTKQVSKPSQLAQTKKAGFLTSIPEDKRQQYIVSRKTNTESLKNSAKAVAVKRGELLQLLAADNFSSETYRKTLDEMIALQNDIQRKRIEPTLQLAESLTTEERKQLVKQLIQQTKRARKPSQEGF